MQSENDHELQDPLPDAPFKAVPFTAMQAREWCKRHKIPFNDLQKWEIREYGPTATVLHVAIRIPREAL